MENAQERMENNVGKEKKPKMKSPNIKRTVGMKMPKISKGKQNSPKKNQKYTYKVNQKIVVCKMRPRHIMFALRNFNSKFAGINKTIRDTLEELKSGTLSVADIPKITVYRWNGNSYTINNKRLCVFKLFSTYYWEMYGIDLMVPVLFREKLNLIRVSRTVGVSPKHISHLKIREKKNNKNHPMSRLNVRSKKGHSRKNVSNEQFKMKKAVIKRIRNGDDFKLFSVTADATDLLTEDPVNILWYRSSRNCTRQSSTLGDYIEKFIGDTCLICCESFIFSHACKGAGNVVEMENEQECDYPETYFELEHEKIDYRHCTMSSLFCSEPFGSFCDNDDSYNQFSQEESFQPVYEEKYGPVYDWFDMEWEDH